MKKQGKDYKCKFVYDEQCDEYDIQIVKRNYKWLWLLLLLLLLLLFIPLKKVLNVKVVDEADQPLPAATVQFEYSPRFFVYNGMFFKKNRFFDEQQTDSLGMTKFGDIHYSVFSVVFQLLSHANIIATAKGYNSETAAPYFHFKRNNETIVIKMHKEEFVTLNFRTLDKEDYSLLLDVDLEITVNGKPYDSIKNSGNGEFSMVVNAIHLVSIKATKHKYYQNEQIKNRRAKELSIANQKERDILMEKIPEVTLEFRTLEAPDMNLFPNVSLSIEVNGQKYTATTDSGNGEFEVTLKPDDVISIHAEKKGYLHNNDIKNRKAQELFDADQSERDIIMKKIPEVKLKFRTLDEYDMTLLPHVSLSIKVNGQKYTSITDSGNGEFTITLKPDDVISIHAEKQGYLPNDDIKNQTAQYLYDADQTERDIIMRLPPCSVKGDDNHKSANGSILEYDMKQAGGTFLFKYFTDSAADHIIVYDCRIADKNPSKIIFDFYDATNSDTRSIRLRFTSRIITVEVIGNTEWNYSVNCPD